MTALPAHILVVEDSPEPLAVVIQVLRLRGYTYDVARSGEEAFSKLRAGPADLILLDLGLPDMDGLEICKRLKETPELCDIPIIMLTGRSAAADRIAGLEIGADDYVVKPFDPGELVARIHVALRRRKAVRETADFSGAQLSVDVKKRNVQVEGREIKLTTKEFDLLALLLKSPGSAVARGDICELIWNKPAAESSRSLETHIWSLRSKLGESGKRIETVGKVGYRFSPTN